MKTTLKFGALLLLPFNLFAQGWSQGKGNGYLKINQNIVSSSKYYAPNGSKVSITTINQYATGFYGEFGINKNLTGLINFPVFVNQSLNAIQYKQSGKTIPGDELNAIGDTDIGLKFGFAQKKSIVWSTSLILGLPFGKTNGGETGILQTGDGEFNQMIRVDASHSFYPKPIYVSAYSGFNNRTKDFSDELRYGFEIGFPFKSFTPVFKLSGIKSLKNGSTLSNQGNLFANNVEFLSPALELNYLLNKKIGLSGAVASALFGKNVLSALNYNFGIFRKW
ncbi:hypothetical protein [Pedobacter cryophilus]|uniref:Transporter n=1 Tax=Pedobacter cryophilus TaxID=2571271 RepID=A0A4U1BU43_9SPHI|nr:hypothetical protein [Pedobacter cryophilus]TKB95768.1 hypothetical protein FA046_15890 [Pedobacter cryophilus]